jgi:hypothetical protein
MKVTVAHFIIILLFLSLTHSFSLLVHERFLFSSSSLPRRFLHHRFLITPKIPPSPGKRMALSSTGKEALNQTHPRSKSISFSPSSQPPSKIKNQNQPIQDQESKSTHPRSRIKINPSSFQPIQDQESKSTHLRSNPSKIKNQNQPIFVSTHSKPIFAFMVGHRPAEPGHWLMGFSPSVPSSCSLASL